MIFKKMLKIIQNFLGSKESFLYIINTFLVGNILNNIFGNIQISALLNIILEIIFAINVIFYIYKEDNK